VLTDKTMNIIKYHFCILPLESLHVSKTKVSIFSELWLPFPALSMTDIVSVEINYQSLSRVNNSKLAILSITSWAKIWQNITYCQWEYSLKKKNSSHTHKTEKFS